MVVVAAWVLLEVLVSASPEPGVVVVAEVVCGLFAGRWLLLWVWMSMSVGFACVGLSSWSRVSWGWLS